MLEQMVLEGEVDLAFASTEGGIPGLAYQLIQRETIGILAAYDTPLAQALPSGTPIQLEQAMDAPFVSLKTGHNVRIVQDRLFQEHGLNPTLFLESDNMEAARQITVNCGCYMLCAHSYTAGQGCFYPLAGYDNQRHFCACYRRGSVCPAMSRRSCTWWPKVWPQTAPDPHRKGGGSASTSAALFMLYYLSLTAIS